MFQYLNEYALNNVVNYREVLNVILYCCRKEVMVSYVNVSLGWSFFLHIYTFFIIYFIFKKNCDFCGKKQVKFALD